MSKLSIGKISSVILILTLKYARSENHIMFAYFVEENYR